MSASSISRRTTAARAVDLAPDPELYRAVVEVFPDVVIEDPWLEDGCREALAGADDRLSFDAPIHSWRDVGKLPVEPRWLNIKPSRFGTLAKLLECIEECEARGIRMYGGGQFELGPGRRQIQRLASLFYADGPNDVAPSEYNDGPAREGLPASPLPAAGRGRLLRTSSTSCVPAASRERRFGEELGATLWGGTVYELAPGERVCPYHWHFGEEEWLLVVSGAPTLRTPGGRARAPCRGTSRCSCAARRVRTRCGTTRASPRASSCSRPSSDPEVCVYPGQRQGRRPRRLEPHRRATGELMNRPEANLDYFDGET